MQRKIQARCVSGISLDGNTSNLGKDAGVRNIVKKYEDVNENNKMEKHRG